MISIKEGIVTKDGEKVGELRNFCCGVDFRIDNRPKALFSILKERLGTSKTKKCVTELLKMKIPNNSFHWNFTYEIAKDKERLKEYQESLLTKTK